MEFMKNIDLAKRITYIFMSCGALDVQLGGKLLKSYYPKFIVMRGFKHTVSLFLNDIYKIPIVNQIITSHKEIYNSFGSVINH